jgi:hypothetical protein
MKPLSYMMAAVAERHMITQSTSNPDSGMLKLPKTLLDLFQKLVNFCSQWTSTLVEIVRKRFETTLAFPTSRAFKDCLLQSLL